MTQDMEGGSPLLLRLFGPMEVRVHGQSLRPLRTRKGLWLLALLALRHGREVQREWLAGTLWPDNEESQALAYLRQTLTDLRNALGAASVLLRAPTTKTLLLDLSNTDCDVVAFDMAIKENEEGGRACPESAERMKDEEGKPSFHPSSLVLHPFERAIDLYRGPLLEGCTEEWVFAERSSRELAYRQALERLADRDRERNDTASAVRRLRLVIGLDPLRESAYGTLMRVLARGGDYAAAVQVYRDLRLLLRDQIQAEPSSDIQVLAEQLRADARQVGAHEARRKEREAHARADTDAPRNISPESRRHNLPQPLTSFVGREQQLEEIEGLLRAGRVDARAEERPRSAAGARLVTLTGAGGVGKTRLALKAASNLLDRFPDGVWMAELDALSDASLLPQAVAAALGLREEPGRSVLETLADLLRPRSALLVLDNCEHLVEACAGLAAVLLSRCPHLRMLATSREALNIEGERVYRVPSLSLPDLDGLERDGRLERDMLRRQADKPDARYATRLESEAVRLFVERAAFALPGFSLTAKNARYVAQICRRLDGIPLALELAAARARVLSVEQIAVRLDDRFRLLTGGDRTKPERHRTLQAALNWSYDLLDEQERLLLGLLSVFAGGWTLEAAETIFGSEAPIPGDGPQSIAGPGVEIEGWEVLDLLTSLVDKSLVVFDEMAVEPRYRMMESVRQYARGKVEETGEAGGLRARHCAYFLRLVEEAEPNLMGAAAAGWLDRLETEHDNIRAALRHCVDLGGESLAAVSDGLDTHEAALRLSEALQMFWEVRGHLSEGRRWVRAVLERESGAGARAQALNGAGRLAYLQGDYAAARALWEESLSLCRQTGDRASIAAPLGNLGVVAQAQGDYTAARAYHEESLAIDREGGDRGGVAHSLNNLGLIAYYQGDYTAAQAYYAESLAIRRELGEWQDVANSLNNLGIVLGDQGDHLAARAYHEESLAIKREIGDRQGVASSLNNLGSVAYRQGDYLAAQMYDEESLAIKREIGDRSGVANSLLNLGRVACVQGDDVSTHALLGESLFLQWQIGNRIGVAALLEAFAGLAVAQSQALRAARLWGAAGHLRAEIGAPLPPSEREAYDRTVARTRSALGEAAFGAAWQEGHDMTLERAFEYALATEGA